MPTVTLSELQALVLDRLENDSVLFTAQEVTNAVNENYRIINLFTGVNQATVSVSGFSVAGQFLYATPAPILLPLYAYFEGRQLRKASFGALVRNDRNWASATTVKNGPVRTWAPYGLTQFVIFPADSLGGRDIQITGVIEPTILVNAGDTISLEDEYLTMIVEMAAHRCQLKEGGKVFADASMMLQTFYRKLKARMMFNQFKAPRYFVTTGPSQAKEGA